MTFLLHRKSGQKRAFGLQSPALVWYDYRSQQQKEGNDDQQQ